MQRLISHIEYLLDNHECVTIPRIGALIKHYVPATIDSVRDEIIPPHQAISFNSELVYDDGLLTTSYSRALGIPYVSAITQLNEDIDHLKGCLADNKEVTLGTLGHLYLQENGALLFTPIDSFFTSHGYQTISLKNSKLEATESTDNTVVLEYTPSYTKRLMHGVMKYAAMLIIMFSLGIILSTPLRYDEGKTMASLTPMSMVNTGDKQEEVAYTIDSSALQAKQALENIPELLMVNPSIHEEPSETSTAPATEISNFKYCLVIASLASMDQAQEFVNNAGNDALGIIECNGRYRVYGATGMSIADVTNTNLQSRYPDAWPCEIK